MVFARPTIWEYRLPIAARFPILLFLVCGLSLATLAQSTTSSSGSLTIEEVLNLTRAGLAEEIIVTKIKKSGKAFDLTTEEILELKRAGVTDNVIRVLMDPNQPYTPPAPKPPPQAAPTIPATPAASSPQKPVDPVVLKIPAEPGFYHSADPARTEFVRLELKPLAAVKSGGKLSSILTAGMKKPSVAGYLTGVAARHRTSGPDPIFFLRLPDKIGIEEIILLTLEVKSDRREIQFGANEAKPLFAAEVVKQYASKQVDAGLFRITAGPLPAGEYLFFMLGSGEEKKGIVGKGWEFGIMAPGGKKP